jgi:hypothetical protein
VASLSRAKKQTQLILKWGGIALAIIFIFFIGIKLVTFIINMMTPPAPPEASFGKLPAILFPNQTKENISYSLDTLTGFLPSFSDRTKVYRITPAQPTLIGLDRAREKVSKVNFNSSGTQISEDTYQWVDQSESLQKRLTMNIFSSEFTLSSSYLISQSLQTFSGPDEKNQAIDTAESFLSEMFLFTQDIDENKTKITLYSISNSALSPTSKISDAKIARVDLFQKDINSLPIYYEKGILSNIDFLVGKEKDILEVVDAHFFHKDISETSSTYAIKTASEAFSELKNGKAYIANKPDNMVEFTIKKVFLAYYIGEDEQEYLMPIVVFEGNDDFVAYVSAVKDEWISN